MTYHHDNNPDPYLEPMDTAEFREAMAALGWTNASAAQKLGVTLRTAAGYATGGTIPLSIAILTRLRLREGAQRKRA